jgi:hypothetical protein
MNAYYRHESIILYADSNRHIQKRELVRIQNRHCVSHLGLESNQRPPIIRVERNRGPSPTGLDDEPRADEIFDRFNLGHEAPVLPRGVTEAICGLQKPYVDVVLVREVGEVGEDGLVSEVGEVLLFHHPKIDATHAHSRDSSSRLINPDQLRLSFG